MRENLSNSYPAHLKPSAVALLAAALAATIAGSQALAEQPEAAAVVSSTKTPLPPPWIACDDASRVAYFAVRPALNPHAVFTHPIKVHLKAGQSCAMLK